MKWTHAKWFGNLCRLMALVFLLETALPAAHGLPMPSLSLGPVPALAQGPEWLASTKDADFTDRFIQEKLSEIAPGIDGALAYVQNDIHFEAYTGSLRGARGTLWSGAGNSLDQASLLISLLRAQGIACRYVRGTLPGEEVQLLIRSMFNGEKMANAVGYIPEESHGTRWPINDPENDPGIQTWVSDHWWVELEDGGQLDPCFTGDRVPGTMVSTHFEVPDELRHKVVVRLKAEFYNLLSQYQYKVPLEQTFATADVYGRPLTIGHFVSTYQPPALIGGFKTYTYSPYISVEDNDEIPENNHIIQGEDFQEFFNTLITPANTTLTRLTLEMEVNDPGRAPDIRTRDLLDRVGVAARHGMGEPAGVDTQRPAFTEFDLTTLYIMPGFIRWEGIEPIQDGLRVLGEDAETLNPLVEGVMAKPPEEWNPEDQEIIRQHTALSRMIQSQGMGVTAAMFIRDSDHYAKLMRESHLVKAYYDTPRLILCQSRMRPSEGETAGEMEIGLDLRRNHIRAIPYPGQNAFADFLFNMRKGKWDSLLEHGIMDLVLKNSATTSRLAVSTTAVWLAAQDQGIPIRELKGTGDIPGRLETLDISPEAKARIAQALRSGRAVNVPAAMVDVDGTPAIGWYETDMETGEVVSVSENGGRQEAIEFVLICTLVAVSGIFVTVLFGNKINDFFTGESSYPVTSQDNTPVIDSSSMPKWQPDYEPTVNIGPEDSITYESGGNLTTIIGGLNLNINIPELNDVFQATGASGSIIDYAGTDTEVITLFAPSLSDLTGNRLDGPGIGLETVNDAAFWVKTGENQIPSAFRARISNTAANDDFILEGTAPQGWEVLISREVNPIPAGVTGEVSAFLRPLENTPIPEPGSVVYFDLTAARSDDSAAALTQTMAFTVPEIHTLSMQAHPDTLYMKPGGTVETTVTLTNTGNVSQSVDIALMLPPGFTTQDPGPTAVLEPGGTITRTLAVTAQGELDTSHTAWLTADYGGAEKKQALSLCIAAPGSIQALEASNEAERMGMDGLVTTLEVLGRDLSLLYQNQADASYKSRVLAGLVSLAGQMDDPLLAEIAADIESSRDVIDTSTPATLGAALDQLGTILTQFNQQLAAMAAHNFELALSPNRAETLPDTPEKFGIFLKNTGTMTTTYRLTLSDLPPGITGSLNRDTITIPPGWSVDPKFTGTHILPIDIFATLTQPAHELTAFDFTVTATAEEASKITRTVHGGFTARQEMVEVVEVTAAPAFADPGDEISLSARLLNAVNRDRNLLVSCMVKDARENMVFQIPPVETQLTVLASLDTVKLGRLDTAGYVPGTYSIEVTVTEADGTPVAGGSGRGSLLVGSPITAAISLDRSEMSPGDGTVQVRLDLKSLMEYGTKGIYPVGLVDTRANAGSLAINGDYAYVGGTEDLTVVNISDAANPVIMSTFGEEAAHAYVNCRLVGDHLAVTSGWTHLYVYNLDDPALPKKIGEELTGYNWLHGSFAQGNHLFVQTDIFGFTSSSIVFVRGDMLSFDLSDPTAPFQSDPLFNTPQASYPQWPGSMYFMGYAACSGDIALLPSTTGQTTASSGTGRIHLVDISDSSKLSIRGTLDIPGTRVLTGVGIMENRALVCGSTSGFILQNGSPFLTGNMTLTLLDTTDPANPLILNTRIEDTVNMGSSSINAVPGLNGYFALSQANIGGDPAIILIDTSDPADLKLFHRKTESLVNECLFRGNTLYTTSTNGLGIYDIGSLTGIPLDVRIRVPKNSVVPGSFNTPPDDVVAGENYDTLVWHPLFTEDVTENSLTWQAEVNGITPGDARPVTLDSQITFTALGTRGLIPLPPVSVACEQFLSLEPSTQTVRPGQDAQFTLTLKNPLGSPVDVDFSLQGLDPAWVIGLAGASVPAESTLEQTFILRSNTAAVTGDYSFEVTASFASGISGRVAGSLILDGRPLAVSSAEGVVVSLAPSQISAGQGSSGTFVVRVTNTGSAVDTYGLSADLPPGFQADFGQPAIEITPGMDNYRETSLRITPPQGTPEGAYPVTVSAVSASNASIVSEANGSVMVSGFGVTLGLSPDFGPPGSRFDLNVTNTGNQTDTFSITLGGPAAPSTVLESAQVTLGAGESRTLALDVGTIDYAYAGGLNLIARAVSIGNEEVDAIASATVAIIDTQGITARFDPDQRVLTEPGSSVFLLGLRNTGNREEAFKAEITGTSGPVTASLRGLDGVPSQSIPIFRLPGLASGIIALDLGLYGPGQGTATIRVVSISDGSISASDTATILLGNQEPMANAGPDQVVHVGTTAVLDGGMSQDPDNGPSALEFFWTFFGIPQDSSLTSADIASAETPYPSFVPDVPGGYHLLLKVSDGTAQSADDVFVKSENTPPVADAGNDQNTPTGQPFSLDGSNSYDPDNDLITYDWGVEWDINAKPAGSLLSNASITGRETPSPSFIPDLPGEYEFRLIVRDNWSQSQADHVVIMALPENTPPNAYAGEDRNTWTGEPVLLDGTGSSDPDQGPVPLTFSWNLKEIPQTSGLKDDDIKNSDNALAEFTPDVPGLFVISLTVDDGMDTDDDSVRISASDHNVPPNADAGEDIEVILGEEIRLDGSKSIDPDNDPSPLAYFWTFVSLAPESLLENSDLRDEESAEPSFIPDVTGIYVLQLKVTDGEADAFDNIQVTVLPMGAEPISDLTARAKLGTVSLRWSPVSGSSGYNIYRATAPGGPYALLAGGYQSSYASYQDFSVMNGTTYYYVVRWQDSQGGESKSSNEVTITPMSTRIKR